MRGKLNWKACALPLGSVTLLFVLCTILVFAGARRDRYEVEAVYNNAAHTLTVRQTAHITGHADEPMDALLFHLPANAYRQCVVPRSEEANAYPHGFSAGGVEVQSVVVADREVEWSLEGAQETFLRVKLPFSLHKHGSVKVEMQYAVTLPHAHTRLGYSDDHTRLTHTFAILCVHDGDQFIAHDPAPVGDPTYAACADWNVSLALPDGYTAAGVGFHEENGRIWSFRGRDVREMALFCSREYEMAETVQDGVTLRAFAFDEAEAQEALGYACYALATFSALFGDYPYADFTVCAGDLYAGGMEYPGVVLIDRDLFGAEDGLLEFCVAHEAAHQWWYAAVGSDPYEHPWQDEALAEYSTLLYYESRYGKASFDSLYAAMLRPATESAALRNVGIAQNVYAFDSLSTYDALIYRKGAAALHDVRVLLGNESFLSALRDYYKRNRFALAQPQDLYSSLGTEGSSLLHGWLSGEMPDLICSSSLGRSTGCGAGSMVTGS